MIYIRFALRLQKSVAKITTAFLSVMNVKDGNLDSLMLCSVDRASRYNPCK